MELIAVLRRTHQQELPHITKEVLWNVQLSPGFICPDQHAAWRILVLPIVLLVYCNALPVAEHKGNVCDLLGQGKLL